MHPLKLDLTTKFLPGEEVHEVFLDDDIGAWNVSSWKIDRLAIFVLSEKRLDISYMSGDWQIPAHESNNFFRNSYDAAKEAKRRNNELLSRVHKMYDEYNALLSKSKPKKKSKKKGK